MSEQRKRSLNRAALRRARKLMRGGVAVGLLAAGACSDGHHVPTHAAPSGSGGSNGANDAGTGHQGFGDGVATPPAMTPFPGSSGGGVAGAGIIGGAPSMPRLPAFATATNVLYSWTTDQQLDELRANPVLLTRSENSDGTRTHLSAVIDALADQSNPLATVLTGGAFVKGRYGWTNPWATLRGWPGEDYGNRLLRIELEPEAWIAVLSQNVFSVVDMKSNPVAMAAALGTPERIGAVYYLNEGENSDASCGTLQNGCANGTYREYFINNEKMVKAWSFGTQEILDALQSSIDFLTLLQGMDGVAPTDPCDFTRAAYCNWQRVFAPDSGFSGYMDGLAITSEYYVPTADNLDALIRALEDAKFEPDPVVHEP